MPYKACESDGHWQVINTETEEVRADELSEEDAKRLERTLNKMEEELDHDDTP
jgi:hypothetical protein